VTRRALVTGASGFVGRHLVARLVTDGWHVRALCRRAAPAGADAVPADADLHALAASVGIDAVFHLAAAVSSAVAPEDLSASLESNVGVGLRVLDAFGPRCPIVLTGSMWQHVDAQPYRAATLYAALKQAQLDVAAYYADTGATVADVELTDTYGADDDRARLLGALLVAARTGEPLALTPGEQLVDLVHVDDVVEGLVRAHTAAREAGPGLHRWSVSSGAPITVRELVARCASAWGRAVPVQFGARPYRAHEMFTPWTVHPAVPGHDAPRRPLVSGLAALDRPSDGASTRSSDRPQEAHRGPIHAHHP